MQPQQQRAPQWRLWGRRGVGPCWSPRLSPASLARTALRCPMYARRPDDRWCSHAYLKPGLPCPARRGTGPGSSAPTASSSNPAASRAAPAAHATTRARPCASQRGKPSRGRRAGGEKAGVPQGDARIHTSHAHRARCAERELDASGCQLVPRRSRQMVAGQGVA